MRIEGSDSAVEHTITALTRAGSDTKLPHGVKVAKVDYDVQEELVVPFLLCRTLYETVWWLLCFSSRADLTYALH